VLEAAPAAYLPGSAIPASTTPIGVLQVHMSHPSASLGRTKLVLAADDNPNNLRLLEVILESQGYAFIGVAGGSECLEMMQRYSPDLVILDVEMPGLDGFETCRLLRARETGVHVPVAFYTAHHLDSDLRRGIAAGGNDFLLKPIEPEKLISRVRRLTEFAVKLRPSRSKAGLPRGAVLWA
jgi:CheY-like chemotaxis protein